VASVFGLSAELVWKRHYIYYTGQLIGAVLAGLLYKAFWAREEKRWLLK